MMTITLNDNLKKTEKVIEDELLYARRKNEEAFFELEVCCSASAKKEKRFDFVQQIFSSVIICTQDQNVVNFCGEWTFEILPLSKAATLLAFIDLWATKLAPKKQPGSTPALPGKMVKPRDKINITFIKDEFISFLDVTVQCKVDPENATLNSLFTYVQDQESYWISHFLLSQSINGEDGFNQQKIKDSCKAYGVSESYFRKLCYKIFFSGPKKQLRAWRAANCILQLVYDTETISAIADNNGFSSSSHFSCEVKELFGITPSEIKKIENLLHN